jgi:hypothetical protein
VISPDLQQFGSRAHAACSLTFNFIQGFALQVAAATAVADNCTEEDGVGPQTISGYYSRTSAWMASVQKLGAPGDLQAVAVAARSLFEGQVDLVLLHYSPKDHPPQMVFDWERSALLKHAEKVGRFFKGKAVPPAYDQVGAFLAGPEVSEIRTARAKWWNGTHPPRWTGKNLETDARRADLLFPEGKLAEFYELEYSPSCWGAHGSSMAGMRSNDASLVIATCAVQLVTVQGLALKNISLVLENLGLYLQVQFDDFERELAQRIAA